MSADANRRNIERAFEAFNDHDVEAVRGEVADDYVDHGAPPELGEGFEATKGNIEGLFEASPDARFELLDVVADDTSGAARFRLMGTHRGEFMGIAATSREIDIEALEYLHFDDHGKAAAHWGYMNQLDLLQQLGAVPMQRV